MSSDLRKPRGGSPATRLNALEQAMSSESDALTEKVRCMSDRELDDVLLAEALECEQKGNSLEAHRLRALVARDGYPQLTRDEALAWADEEEARGDRHGANCLRIITAPDDEELDPALRMSVQQGMGAGR